MTPTLELPELYAKAREQLAILKSRPSLTSVEAKELEKVQETIRNFEESAKMNFEISAPDEHAQFLGIG
jgi:hypothetical protein